MFRNCKIIFSVFLVLGVLFYCGTAIVTSIAKSPEIHNGYLRAKVGSKIVMIMGEDGGGTGFHINLPSGDVAILTNSHICDMQKEGVLQVRLNDQNRYVPRRVIESYSKHDLCLVEGLTGVEGIDLADKTLSPGEVVRLIGYPRLTPLTVSTGEFLAYTNIQILDMATRVAVPTQTPMADLLPDGGMTFELKEYRAGHISNISYPGNSGSPVVDFSGDVVGVLFAGNRYIITVGYVVPLDTIREFISVY